MIIAANFEYNVGKELHKLYPTAKFCSRRLGYDFSLQSSVDRFSEECLEHECILLVSSLSNFNLINLYDTVHKKCTEANHSPHIVVFGSTIDRKSNGNGRVYATEKRALRDHTVNLNLRSCSENSPRTTLISFGSMESMKQKFPTQKCLSLETVGHYVKWVIDQPSSININEISIDPVEDYA